MTGDDDVCDGVGYRPERRYKGHKPDVPIVLEFGILRVVLAVDGVIYVRLVILDHSV